MQSLSFDEVKNAAEVAQLSETAYSIWREFFPAVISGEQIEYMLEKFQSPQALEEQIAEGYRYFIVHIDEEAAGYFGVCRKPDGSLFLSKLYLKKENRGKGIASLMFKKIKQLARENGCEMIWLTVNKGNTHAINVYKKFGMRLLREECTDIGGGFVMDDYVFGYYV